MAPPWPTHTQTIAMFATQPGKGASRKAATPFPSHHPLTRATPTHAVASCVIVASSSTPDMALQAESRNKSGVRMCADGDGGGGSLPTLTCCSALSVRFIFKYTCTHSADLQGRTSKHSHTVLHDAEGGKGMCATNPHISRVSPVWQAFRASTKLPSRE